MKTPKNLVNGKGNGTNTNMEDAKKFVKRPSVVLREEGLSILKNYKSYKSFQPVKLYEFKY